MPNNLPGELTSFVGRRAELARIGEPLQRVRLLTLTGSGGCGKTRLALQAAADAMDHHPDGVWWRVRVLAPEQIARALSDRFHLLTGGARTVMPRHQTLQASIDWSHELLDDGERALLRRLSVFAGGWTLDAAEQVCPGEGIDRYGVLDLVTGLVDKSLVTIDDQGPQTRYRLLETVRQYATARLADAGEVDSLRDRHLAYHLRLAEAAEPHVLGAGRDYPVLCTLATELPNLRAALERAAATNPDAAGEEPTPLRARVLAGRGILARYGGAYKAAHGWAQAALAVGQECGDLWAQGRAYDTLGLMASLGDPAGGRPLLERSLEPATQSGDDWCRISAAQVIAIGWILQDEFDTARPILDEAYATATRLGCRWGFAWHWYCMGWEATLHGRLNEAWELLARTVAASDEVGNPVTHGFANLREKLGTDSYDVAYAAGAALGTDEAVAYVHRARSRGLAGWSA